MNLQPLGDRLIVEVLEEEETTVSGIVLPDTAKEKPQRGRVLAVGPGARDEDGEHIPLDLEEGDEIIFSKYGGTEIKLGADEVLILRESDVLAKVVGDRDHGDDHFWRVAERCVEEAADPRARVLAGVLGRLADEPRERYERDRRQNEKGDLARMRGQVDDERDRRKRERCPEESSRHDGLA